MFERDNISPDISACYHNSVEMISATVCKFGGVSMLPCCSPFVSSVLLLLLCSPSLGTVRFPIRGIIRVHLSACVLG